ncbi:hypothetical protein PSHT_02536 [Puccinia striiformis]|uniref:Uncharacterized protein n=2 Tax=Puccinia striiformis TaxID=27350 RepID=A0A2S4VWT7_9BASI|nr:hypothetical protein PSTT_03361 [Puccinia striiformis]POW21297.1 hypothetical protein PSHT_02536 [Puccinia striiformis]
MHVIVDEPLGYITRTLNAPSYVWICTILPRRDSPVGPVTYPLAPWQPSCADTRLKFPGDPILNLCCNNAVRGIDPKKPTQFVTVTINDFNNKVQCRVAPNSP